MTLESALPTLVVLDPFAGHMVVDEQAAARNVASTIFGASLRFISQSDGLALALLSGLAGGLLTWVVLETFRARANITARPRLPGRPPLWGTPRALSTGKALGRYGFATKPKARPSPPLTQTAPSRPQKGAFNPP